MPAGWLGRHRSVVVEVGRMMMMMMMAIILVVVKRLHSACSVSANLCHELTMSETIDSAPFPVQAISENLCHELTIREVIDSAPFRVQPISTRTQPE